MGIERIKGDDTITAISTPYGTGGIGIIRISGEEAFKIGKRIFKGSKTFESIKTGTINHGHIIDPEDGSLIDEVLLTKMYKPKTYTKEDTIEINCHSGIVVLKRILELVVKEGARIAEPGEFTKRAFLNGRIDLAQAEAVIDLINAKTLRSSKIAVDQLEGRVSTKIKNLRDKLVTLAAHVEATLDYPEEGIDEITELEISQGLDKIKNKLLSLLAGFEKGRIIKDGIKTVIIGKPNVGKSSLLNQLAGYDKAIVTDVPGTTRDTIEEYISIAGIPIKIVDTAGIRDTKDKVEKLGVKRTMDAIESADLVIMMIDIITGFTKEDEDVLEHINNIGGKFPVVLLNKIDLLEEPKGGFGEEPAKIYDAIYYLYDESDISIIETSMKDGRGISQLEKEIYKLFIGEEISIDSEIITANVRHGSLLKEALDDIRNAKAAHKSGITLDCVAIDINSAAHHLGEITGESVSDAIIEQIFSRFCIGK